MKYRHHQLEYEIDDEWLTEAGVRSFKPSRDYYRAAPTAEMVFIVPIDGVEPLMERAESKGIFCDDTNAGVSARQRVIRILHWFVADDEVEPVKVVMSNSADYKYKLVEGCHRFYCAHAMGFKGVPATMGFDINALYV